MNNKYLQTALNTIIIMVLVSGCGGSLTGDASSSSSDSAIFEDASTRVPHTNQTECFDSEGNSVTCVNSGQDGAYLNNLPSYTDNNDGTVTDDITDLVWQQTADSNGDGVIDVDDKMTQEEAASYCGNLMLAGLSDWRLPDIKEMYSLIDFSGEDVSGYSGTDTAGLTPFIDDTIFGYGYGDTSAGERIIDAQWATTTNSVAGVMGYSDAMFGVNFADGRIKGYGTGGKTFYVQCVRENSAYGVNGFTDNGDGTVSDAATNLMWQQNDNGEALTWDGAISYCENLTSADYADWRLPNAKELQSIVDYTRSPDTTNSAAIDTDYFNATQIVNEAGQEDYGFYWTGTTHKTTLGGQSAVYVSFGRALGYMNDTWMDVHGAGAQRSDPKDMTHLDAAYTQAITYNGDTAIIHGPQGDVVRGANFARCVRSIE